MSVSKKATNNILRERLYQLMPKTGDYRTGITGFGMHRRDDSGTLDNCLYRPMVSVVVQGSKRMTLGSKEYIYKAGQCMVVGVDMPCMNFITDASPEAAFLSISLDLDKSLIAQLALKAPPQTRQNGSSRGVSITDTTPEVLDAFLRLSKLVGNPSKIPVLAPMIIKEIHFCLLLGPQGDVLRAVTTAGSQSNQIASAIGWLQSNYTKPLDIDMLARQVHMARSTFHRHFREVTSLSPLQYQKRLRLHEAQRLMLDGLDAAIAGNNVGYDSPAHFTREYKRLFGEPPRRDVSRLR